MMQAMDGEPIAEVRGKRRRRILRRLLIAAGALAVLAVVVYGVFMLALVEGMKDLGEWWSYDRGCLGSGPPYDLAVVERRAGLTFPASARQIDAHSVTFQDCVVFVRFEMASDDLEAFLVSTRVASLTATSGRGLWPFFGWMQHDVDWQFEESATYLYGEDEIQQIVVDMTHSDALIVYVIMLLM